jgi:hypothetical protein
VRRGVQAGGRQRLVDGLRAGGLAREVEQVGHVLARAQMLVERHVLGDVCELAPRGRRVGHRVGAVHANATTPGLHEAQEQAQRGGLAGAVGTQQRVDLTGFDPEVQLVQDGAPAIAGDHAGGFEGGMGRGCGARRWKVGQGHGLHSLAFRTWLASRW